MIFRSRLGIGRKLRLWPTLLASVLAIKAVLALALRPNFVLDSYCTIIYFLLLVAATAFALWNGVRRTTGSRMFWIFVASGCGLWAFDQWFYLYYEVGLHTNVPDGSVADPALFLHIVPLMAAVAMLPHSHRSDQKPSRATLNFLLLLFFWVLLYAYVLFPYQYLFANAAVYNPRFTALYAVENAALVLALGISTFRARAPWRSVYLHFFGASALYGVSSTLANIAIDSGWQYHGSIYSFAQTAAVCWFVWVPLRARQLPLAEVTPAEPDAGFTGFTSLMASMAVIAIPLIGMWELFRTGESPGMRSFRLLVVLASVLLLVVVVLLREYLARRDLVLDSRRNRLQRKLSQAALVESEGRLREYEKAVEGLEEMMVVVDRNYRYVLANRAFLKYRNLEREQLIGRLAADIVSPDIFESVVKAKLDECLQGKVVRYELRYNYAHLGERDLFISYFPIEGPRGIDRVACVLQDITERKRVENNLRQSETEAKARAEELAVILDAVPGMALIAHDPHCRRITGSRAAYGLLRLPYGANISKSAPEGERPSNFRVCKDGHELRFQELPIQMAAANGREVRDFEMTILFDDGTSRQVLGNAAPLLDQHAEVRGAVGVFVDITERKRAEEALREREEKFHQMADNIQEMFWMVEAASKQVIYVNPAFEQIAGRTVASLLDAPLSYREVIHPEDRARALKSLDEAERTGVLNEEFRIVRPDGTIRWVEARGFSIRDAQGRVYRLAGVVQDITERRQAEEALRNSEREQFEIAKQLEIESARLIEAQAVAKVGSWEAELPSLKVSWSEQTHQIFGTDPSHFQPSRPDFAKLVHPEDRAKVDAAFEASLEKRAPSTIEYRIISADGRVKVLEEHWKVFHNEQGQPVRLTGTCQDITERKRAEEALRQSEDRYRDLVEHSQDLLCTHDLEGRLLSCNPAPARILGYEVAELLKIPMREIIAPEFREQFDQYLIRLKTSGAAKGLMAVITRTGERRIWEYDNTLRTEGVASPIVRGMAHDITERKRAEMALRQSEEDYRMFVAQSSEGIFRQDLDAPVPIDLPEDELIHHILYGSYLANCNDAIAKMYGLNSAQEFIGKRLTETVDPTDPRNIELAREYVRSGFRVLERESHEVDAHGNPKIFLNSMIGIVEDRKLLRTWGIQRDITERRRAEQALQKAHEELARVNRIATLGELTASIAHEINQPLGAVVTNASAARRWLEADPPNLTEAREAMAQTIEQADLASEVIKRARLMLQKSPPERQPLEINDIIREALALSSNELLRGRVTVRSEVAADLPAVLGDRVQLQQVMLNLILNAIEAMSTVSGRPRMLWIKAARAGDEVEVHVQDSGMGLKPEELERIFDPFVTSKAEGIGMGLSISRSIVAVHGGRVWATSGFPHGAIFHVRLPARRVSDEQVA